jgi:hypothetical protein
MRVPVPLRAAAMGYRQRARSYLQASTRRAKHIRITYLSELQVLTLKLCASFTVRPEIR